MLLSATSAWLNLVSWQDFITVESVELVSAAAARNSSSRSLSMPTTSEYASARTASRICTRSQSCKRWETRSTPRLINRIQSSENSTRAAQMSKRVFTAVPTSSNPTTMRSNSDQISYTPVRTKTPTRPMKPSSDATILTRYHQRTNIRKKAQMRRINRIKTNDRICLLSLSLTFLVAQI